MVCIKSAKKMVTAHSTCPLPPTDLPEAQTCPAKEQTSLPGVPEMGFLEVTPTEPPNRSSERIWWSIRTVWGFLVSSSSGGQKEISSDMLVLDFDWAKLHLKGKEFEVGSKKNIIWRCVGTYSKDAPYWIFMVSKGKAFGRWYNCCNICSVLLIVTALKKADVFASNRNTHYEMIENRTIAASSKWAWWNICRSNLLQIKPLGR